jgi:6-pyruvoyltetrahydropterin/6-carboxytetrahydropterin synthase
MGYEIEVERRLTAMQGLQSPVRARRGLSLIKPGAGVPLRLRVGVAFAADQLDEDGRFLDTDALDEELDATCALLAAQPWTAIFPFRPTYERVARHLFERLADRIPQLAYVELADETFGTRTRYAP